MSNQCDPCHAESGDSHADMPRPASPQPLPSAPYGGTAARPTPSVRRAGAQTRGPGAPTRYVSGTLVEFNTELMVLSDAQQRVLRLLLTGARVALIAGAAGEHRRVLDRWLGTEHVYLATLRAVQRDLGPSARAHLHTYITRELIWENDEGLDAEAWATLAVIRALGRLDAETGVLDQSLLRNHTWSTTLP